MIFDLCRLLKEHLVASLAQTNLEVPQPPGQDQDYSAPNVYIGSPPPKQKDDEPEYVPLVVVRATEGGGMNDGRNSEEVKVSIICRAYAGEDHESGEQEVLGLLWRVRCAVKGIPKLAERYERQGEPKWFTDAQQKYPYLLAQVDTVWRFVAPQPQLTPDKEIEIYGSGYK